MRRYDSDKGDFIVASQGKLLSYHLQGAPFDTSEEDAHIFDTRSELLLSVRRIVCQVGCPAAIFSVQYFNSEPEGRSCDLRRRENKHALFDQSQLNQVLG